MFEYLKEWNEACVYAKECLPSFAYVLTREPYSTVLVFAAVCLGLYLINEYGLARVRSRTKQ